LIVYDNSCVYMLSLLCNHAIVTVCNRVIGYHTVLLIANEGVNVAIIGRDRGALDTAVKNLVDTGVKVLSLKADVADEADVKDAVTKISSEFDSIDILINNAGMMGSEIGRASCRERV